MVGQVWVTPIARAGMSLHGLRKALREDKTQWGLSSWQAVRERVQKTLGKTADSPSEKGAPIRRVPMY